MSRLSLISITAFVVICIMLAATTRSDAQAIPINPIYPELCEPGDQFCSCSFSYYPPLCFIDVADVLTVHPGALSYEYITSGPARMDSFAIRDTGLGGFSTGEYRSGLPDCGNPFPATNVGSGCATNGFLKVSFSHGYYYEFGFSGPAYDENGAVIFGTIEDRMLLRLDVAIVGCNPTFIPTCYFAPTLLTVTAENGSGLSFENGFSFDGFSIGTPGAQAVQTISLEYFNYPNLRWAYAYSIEGGSSTSVIETIFGMPIYLDIVMPSQAHVYPYFDEEVLFDPWGNGVAEFSPDDDTPVRLNAHNVPEPGTSLMLVFGAIGLIGLWALRRANQS